MNPTKWRVKLRRGLEPSHALRYAVLPPRVEGAAPAGWAPYDSLHYTIDEAIAHAEKRAAGCRCPAHMVRIGGHELMCVAWARWLAEGGSSA